MKPQHSLQKIKGKPTTSTPTNDITEPYSLTASVLISERNAAGFTGLARKR